jgi:hypothetical protein
MTEAIISQEIQQEVKTFNLHVQRRKKKLLLISAIFVLALAPATVRADDPICGSLEAFQRSHRWQDLPGCTEKRDYEDQLSAVTLLGRAKDAFKGFFENWEKGEVEEAEHYAGGALSYMNGADAEWHSNPELAAARPAYDEMRSRVKQYVDWAPLVKELADSYFKTVIMIEEAKKGAQYAAETAQSNARELKKVMDRAARANVPDSFIVPGIGEVRPATVAEIKTMIEPLIGQANEAVAAEKAADDAKWRPFTSQLGGERLKFFNETYRIGTNVYGVGGKYLDTPEEFRAATVMCTQSFTTDQLVERWTVSCYGFRGDRRVSGPRVTSGYGRAPASAYR